MGISIILKKSRLHLFFLYPCILSPPVLSLFTTSLVTSYNISIKWLHWWCALITSNKTLGQMRNKVVGSNAALHLHCLFIKMYWVKKNLSGSRCRLSKPEVLLQPSLSFWLKTAKKKQSYDRLFSSCVGRSLWVVTDDNSLKRSV